MDENKTLPEVENDSVEFPETEVLEDEVWETDTPRELPMRWHKFLIYFSLWIAAARDIVGVFGDIPFLLKNSSLIWNEYPLYLVLCILSLIFTLSMACFLIYVRFSLARFKKHAPRRLIMLQVLNTIGYSVFMVSASLSMGLSPFTGFRVDYIIGPAIFIIINNKYYYRRRHLFVN